MATDALKSDIKNTSIRIDQGWLDENQNPKADKSFLGLLSEYPSKAAGAFRSLQVIKGLSRLWNTLTVNPSTVTTTLESGAGTAMSGLGIVRLPSATKDAMDRVVDLAKDNDVSFGRKIGLAIRDVTDAISTWIYTGIFLTGKTTLLRVAQFADVGGDSADLTLSVVDYKKAADCEAAASGEVKEVFTHTKNYNMLRIAKAVVSLVSGILAIMMFISSAFTVSVVALVLLSLSSAFLAIRRDIYKDQGRFSVVSFERPVTV